MSEGNKITISKFNGLYQRGYLDECPPDHSPDCLNLIFNKTEGVSTRRGSIQSYFLVHNVVRQFVSTISGVSRMITLDSAGNLYVDTGVAILSNVHMVDFVALNLFNKTFILPKCNAPGPPLQVYNGSTIRNAAGIAPVNGGTPMAAVDSATAGSISPGVHKVAVAYVTDTGYTTKPGPTTAGVFAPATWTAAGSKKVDITFIPTGPTGTVARQLLFTKAGGEEYFYLAAGFINDNTTTTITVDFFDTDLAISADSLFDLIETIGPSGTYGDMDEYHGRMVVLGFNASFFSGAFSLNPDLVLVSDVNNAEAFSSVTGYVQLPANNDLNTAAGCFVYNDVLYLTKPRGIFAATDNSDVPSSWVLVVIDEGVGAIGYGIASIDASRAHLNTMNLVLLADLHGLYAFTGVVQRPALTWKIEDLWFSSIGTTNIAKVTVLLDMTYNLIYIAATGASQLLTGNIDKSIGFDAVRWCPWTFPSSILSISLSRITDNIGTDLEPTFRFSLSGSNNSLFKLTPVLTFAQYTDNGTAYSSYYTTYLMFYGLGSVNVFNQIIARIIFGGNVSGSPTRTYNYVLYNEDFTSSVTTANVTVPIVVAGKDYILPINFVNEKMLAKINFGTEGFNLMRLDIFGKAMWQSRPA